ncbi:MAG TPA: hypothetical protein V6D17_18085, partial [Candidatus Obscuribacterales bacterium]
MSDVVSESTVQPTADALHNAASSEAAREALALMAEANPANDPAIIRDQAVALISVGALPDTLLSFDTSGDGILDGNDMGAGTTLAFFNGSDDLIDANDRDTTLRDAVEKGSIMVEGVPVQLTYDQRIQAAVLEQSLNAMDGIGGDRKIGAGDYNAIVSGDRKALMDDSFYGAEAAIVAFNYPQAIEKVFGTPTVERAQLDLAYEHPENYSELEWRAIEFLHDNWDFAARSGVINGHEQSLSGFEDNTTTLSWADIRGLGDEYGINIDDSAALGATQARQENVNEMSNDWEIAAGALPDSSAMAPVEEAAPVEGTAPV